MPRHSEWDNTDPARLLYCWYELYYGGPVILRPVQLQFREDVELLAQSLAVAATMLPHRPEADPDPDPRGEDTQW